MKGVLSEGQRTQLEALGMVWEPNEAAWDEGARQLAAYKEKHGDCLVPKRHETEDGLKLGHSGSTRAARAG